MTAFGRIFACLLIAAGSSVAHADLVLNVTSEAGNYVGQGWTQQLTFTSAQVTTNVYSNGDIVLSGNSGVHTFSLLLGALKTTFPRSPVAGVCYERALGDSSRNIGRPGIDFAIDYRRSSGAMGRFRIREITLSGNQVQSLAVDLVQHQDVAGGGAVYANLRWNSAIDPATPFIEPVYRSRGELAFTALPGGAGESAPGGTATLAMVPQSTRVKLNFGYATSFIYNGPLPGGTTDFTSWEADFAAVDKVIPGVGNYPNATGFPFQAAGTPGMYFTYNGHGSSNLTGNYVVTRARYDAFDGFPVDFAVAFTQFYNGDPTARTDGTIIYQTEFRNGGPGLFASSFEDVDSATVMNSLAYPCDMP